MAEEKKKHEPVMLEQPAINMSTIVIHVTGDATVIKPETPHVKIVKDD